MAQRLVDIFFQKSFFEKLAHEIRSAYPSFNSEKFVQKIYSKDWHNKKLKERMHHTSDVLFSFLPKDYKKAIAVLIKVEKKFDGFEHLVFSDFVEKHGIHDYETSIKALEVFTRSSAEFAIRPFIKKYPQTMKQMMRWSKHKEAFVRRLASEGSRPRLPWGMALEEFKKDPKKILPILENLKNDPSETVRRSVANNLNDISKDNPKIALAIAKEWLGKTSETDKLVKHAMRTLLKKGDKEALRLFGFVGGAESIEVFDLEISPTKIKIGDRGVIQFVVENSGVTPLLARIEYSIEYVKAHSRTSTKVFYVQEKEFKSGEEKKYSKKLNFADMTTRKHYPGKHTLRISVNGEEKAEKVFLLAP